MKYWELEQNKVIEKFVKDIKSPTREDLIRFFEYHFLHPDYETEFTHKVAKNIIEVSFEYFSQLPESKKFHFLRSLGKFFDIAISLKIWEYQLSRDDASWYWKGLPTYFLSLTSLVEPLEAVRREMGEVNKNNLHEKIICVEGDTEFNFIETIQLSTRLLYFDFFVYNYGGKGEANNLVHFIKEKNRQGVKVFVVYDKDGRKKSFIEKIKKRAKIERFFVFNKDFESAFPPQILKNSLQTYVNKYTKRKVTFRLKDVGSLLIDKKPFIKAVEEKYDINISKSKLGIILSIEIAQILDSGWHGIFNEKKVDKKYDFEIFKFLKFLIAN